MRSVSNLQVNHILNVVIVRFHRLLSTFNAYILDEEVQIPDATDHGTHYKTHRLRVIPLLTVNNVIRMNFISSHSK